MVNTEEHLAVSEQEKHFIECIDNIAGPQGFFGIGEMLHKMRSGCTENESSYGFSEYAFFAIGFDGKKNALKYNPDAAGQVFLDKQNDTYRIGVRQKTEFAVVWEWKMTPLELQIRGRSNIREAEDDITILTIRNDALTVQRKKDLHTRNLTLTSFTKMKMMAGGLRQQFAAIGAHIDEVQAEERTFYAPLHVAVETLLSEVCPKDSRWVSKTAGSLRIKYANQEKGLIKVNNDPYQISEENVLLPIYISAPDALQGTKEVTIDMPQVHITLLADGACTAKKKFIDSWQVKYFPNGVLRSESDMFAEQLTALTDAMRQAKSVTMVGSS